jgi:hypothetical protein
LAEVEERVKKSLSQPTLLEISGCSLLGQLVEPEAAFCLQTMQIH